MASELPSGPDPTLYLYTSLTAGSSHIITATSRLETILKANKIAFRAIDCATDEKARNLWSRKSKGRKLPGLVKYGVVIGDLKEVEEWNEYGEIHENIDNVSDLFGDTPMTDTPMPPPAPITLQNPLAKIVEPPIRSSSGTRHISISEPKERESSFAGAKDSPMSMALRQAGAEAAAKAGQRKASATASALPAKRDPTETTPMPSATKMSVEAAEPAKDPSITAAKAPAQLAAEGARKTSIDKIAESDSQDTSDTDSSNEEQILEAKRASSVTKAPSRLVQETNISDLKKSVPEQAITSESNLAETAPKSVEVNPSHHHGSSLSEASKQEIAEVEARTAIKEEPEEDSKDESTKIKEPTSKSTIQATDEAEAEATKGINPQDQKAKDANAAGVSAAVAMFLSPNHDPNPKRLSADSASVYSFFDSAFSPAPLFSGAKTLDLNTSFVQDLGKSNPRASISTYGSNYEDEDEEDDKKSVAGEASQDETPRQSKEMERSAEQETKSGSPQGSPRREILPTMPVIAPLRTPARRLASEPLLSDPVSPSSSIPLPLNIRKSPTDPSLSPPLRTRTQTPTPTQSPPPSRSQTYPQPNTLSSRPSTSNRSHHHTPSASVSPSASPITPSTHAHSRSPTPSTPNSDTNSSSRGLRFKKSLLSLRSKKSSQQLLSSPSPPPPTIPAQRHLKDLGVNFGGRNVSDGTKQRERGKLLCF